MLSPQKIKYLIIDKLNTYSKEFDKNIDEMKYLLSYSGGIDSTVLSSILLEIKNEYNIKYSLAHFNHQIQSNSEIIEKHCIDYAATNNLNIYIKRFIFKKCENFESSARNKRYIALDNLLKEYKYDLILTAHHKDDQLETLFMRFFDNSDWISKIGIREKIRNIRRPLLTISRNDILNYSKNKSIKWKEDISNKNLYIRRNYIRHCQLPAARAKMLSFDEKMLKTSEFSIFKHNIFLKYLLINKNNIILNNDINNFTINKLFVEKFNIEEVKLFIYNSVASEFNASISSHSLGFWLEFKNFISNAKSGSKYIIDSLIFYINRNEMIVLNKFDTLRLRRSSLYNNIPWFSGRFIISRKLFYNKMDNDKNIFCIPDNIFDKGLYIRNWKHGDKMLNSNNNKHILLSNLFINNKLSIIEKIIQPIVEDNNRNIIWIPGLIYGYSRPGKYRRVTYIKWVDN